MSEERDTSFAQVTRFEGNISVLPHPESNTKQDFGDGSVEVYGALYADSIKTLNRNVIHIGNGLSFHPQPGLPEVDYPNHPMLYADLQSGGRLMLGTGNGGPTLDINPVRFPGDLMSFSHSQNTSVRVEAGLPGTCLTSDPTRDPDKILNWKYPETWSVYPTSSLTGNRSDINIRYTELPQRSRVEITGSQPMTVPFKLDEGRNDEGAFALDENGETFVAESTALFEVSLSVVCIAAVTEVPDISVLALYLDLDEITVRESQSFITVIRPGKSSVSTSAILELNPGKRLRARVRKIKGEGTVILEAGLGHISIRRLISPESHYLCAANPNGVERSLPPGSPITVETPDIVLQTSGGTPDIVTQEGIVAGSGGRRYVRANFSFRCSSASSTVTSAVVTARVRLFVGGLHVEGATSFAALCADTYASTTLVTLVELGAGQQISFVVDRADSLSSPESETGSLFLLPVATSVILSYPHTPTWKIYEATLHSPTIGLTPLRNEVLDFANVKTTADCFIPAHGGVKVESSGTYGVTYSLNLSAMDAAMGDCTLSLWVRSRDDEAKLVQGSIRDIQVPGSSSRVSTYFTSNIYMKEGTTLQFRATGRGIVNQEGSSLYVEKIENTISNYFGAHFSRSVDGNTVATTNTEFEERAQVIFPKLAHGSYRAGVKFAWDMTHPGHAMEARLMMDDIILLEWNSTFNIQAGFGRFILETGYKYIDIEDGTHHLKLEVRTTNEYVAMVTREVELEFWNSGLLV